jgi:hypothetical protein
MKQAMAPVPGGFLAKPGIGSVVEVWVALDRVSPLTSTSALRFRWLVRGMAAVPGSVGPG